MFQAHSAKFTTLDILRLFCPSFGRFSYIQNLGTYLCQTYSCILSYIQNTWLIQAYLAPSHISSVSGTLFRYYSRAIYAYSENHLGRFRHRNLAYLGTYCLTHIQVYSQSYTYRSIFAHTWPYFRKFRHIQDTGITGSTNVTNTFFSSQVLLITVQIYLKHFFIFASKVYIQYFFLKDSILTITIAIIIIACHQCKHTIHLTHATHISTSPTQAHHSHYPHQHAIQERALPTLHSQASHPPHPRQRKYHAISQTLFIRKSILRILNSYQENSCGKGFQKICF